MYMHTYNCLTRIPIKCKLFHPGMIRIVKAATDISLRQTMICAILRKDCCFLRYNTMAEAEGARIRFVSRARLLLPNRRRKTAVSRGSCKRPREKEKGESRNRSRPCQKARFDPRRWRTNALAR